MMQDIDALAAFMAQLDFQNRFCSHEAGEWAGERGEGAPTRHAR